MPALLVTDYGQNAVSVIPDSGSISTVPVGNDPVGIAYDYGLDSDVYVANQGSNNVSVIEGCSITYGTQCYSVSTGLSPREVVWDQKYLTPFVANYGSSNVSTFGGGPSISGPSGSGFLGIAYDDATDQVFVTAYNTGEVYIFS